MKFRPVVEVYALPAVRVWWEVNAGTLLVRFWSKLLYEGTPVVK